MLAIWVGRMSKDGNMIFALEVVWTEGHYGVVCTEKKPWPSYDSRVEKQQDIHLERTL